MTDSLPAPLVPADCDLRDFPHMQLDVARLRDSDFAALVDPEDAWAGVLLWCAAWHQLPAGSLPDDDRVLSNLAGYGRVVRVWKRHRAGALHGWIKCSDGRLYHPVIAEKAREAWAAKQARHHERMCDRLRKENGRRKAKGLTEIEIPTIDAWLSAGRPTEWTEASPAVPAEKTEFPAGQSAPSSGTDETSADVPPEHPPVSGGNGTRSGGIPAENALKGEGEGEEKEKRDSPLCVPPFEPEPTDPTAPAAPTPQPGSPHDAHARDRTRGTRLPADWWPDAEDWEFARSLGLDPHAVAERFRDYWRAQPGAKGVKLDWKATWRNWCRSDHERQRPIGRSGPGTGGRHAGSLVAAVCDLVAEARSR